MQKLFEAYSRDNRQAKQTTDNQCARLHDNSRLIGCLGLLIWNRLPHEKCRHSIVNNGRNEEFKEIEKLGITRLPDHQGGNVAKRTKRTTRVSRNHQVDKTD